MARSGANFWNNTGLSIMPYSFHTGSYSSKVTHFEGSQNSIVPLGTESAVPGGLDLAAIGICLQMVNGRICLGGGSSDSRLKCRYLRIGA